MHQSLWCDCCWHLLQRRHVSVMAIESIDNLAACSTAYFRWRLRKHRSSALVVIRILIMVKSMHKVFAVAVARPTASGILLAPGGTFVSYLHINCCNRGLTHLPLDKMAAISQTIFWDAFSWMKHFVCWLNFTEVCSLGPVYNNPALVWIMA